MQEGKLLRRAAEDLVGAGGAAIGPAGLAGGGEDAQQAPPAVVRDRGRCGTAPVGDERPIQQEAGDQEEDGHADVEVEHQPARGRIADQPEDAGVDEQHREDGDRPHPVQQRKARVVRRRRDRVGGGRRVLGHVQLPPPASSTTAIASAAAG
ncbi:MAG: hypothetical protein R2700_15770 [Solirubrobacterales bacterium]